jgi:alpha-glucosidase
MHEAHTRGLRVILDLVLNHTSDQHPWFLESKSSRDNPKYDWYVWFDQPPNNWQSCFDGPAFTYVPERGQYYYHYFMQQQPDLNWRNPQVKQAMWQAVRFWLDLGADGFRLDAIGTLFEDPDLTSHSVPLTLAELRLASDRARTPAERERVNRYWQEMFAHQLGQPGLHALMKELRAVLDEYDGERMLVGEDEDLAYLGNGQDELQLVFNFPLMRTDRLTPAHIRANQAERLAALSEVSKNAWPCNTLGNHDSPRVYSQFGDGEHDEQLARLSLATLLTLKGTPFLYNGEEIGMTNTILTDISQFKDSMATWYYQAAVDELGLDPAEALRSAAQQTRDKGRTPLQWQNAPNAGFCPANVQPWLPINPNFAKGVNVSDQDRDPDSLLNFYRRLIAVRRATPALITGTYQPLHAQSEAYLAFLRQTADQTILVVLNFYENQLEIDFSNLTHQTASLIFSSAAAERQLSLPALSTAPFEILIAEVN